MIDKYLYHIPCTRSNDESPQNSEYDTASHLWKTLNTLHATLQDAKNMINQHHNAHNWDTYKKLSNEYENVTLCARDDSSLSNYHVSRSFYKLWEILNDFGKEGGSHCLANSTEHMTAAFLAEGPGGFIEAFYQYRMQQHQRRNKFGMADKMIGMTLLSSDRRVPAWRLPRHMRSRVCICRGDDGTGNLYNPKNIDKLVTAAGGPNSCDLVTADGGFDFSGDFNNQETLSVRLLAAEVYATLRLQRVGGSFVIKIYDVSSPDTMAILNILTSAYTDVYVTKPHTSRPANSEKYLVCTGFRSDGIALFERLQGMLLNLIVNDAPLLWEQDVSLLRCVVAFNHYFVLRQVAYIIKAITCIALAKQGRLKERDLLDIHRRYVDEWYVRYAMTLAEKTQTTYLGN